METSNGMFDGSIRQKQSKEKRKQNKYNLMYMQKIWITSPKTTPTYLQEQKENCLRDWTPGLVICGRGPNHCAMNAHSTDIILLALHFHVYMLLLNRTYTLDYCIDWMRYTLNSHSIMYCEVSIHLCKSLFVEGHDGIQCNQCFNLGDMPWRYKGIH